MKKLIASVLVFAMMFTLSVPAMAEEPNHSSDYYEEFEYIDSLGDQYHGIYTRNDEKAEVVVYDETGNLVSKAVQEHGSDFIVETVPKESDETALVNLSGEMETRIININDYIIPVPEREDIVSPTSTNSVKIDLPGRTYYEQRGTYNTDYIYKGDILQGYGYYRQNGDNDEYNRMSYKFVRNTTINAIVILVGGVYGWVTKTSIINILAGAGISVVGVAITTDWVFNGCVKSFGYDVQCRMEYNGVRIVMSQIEKKLEYLVVEDDDGNVTGVSFDDFSYNTPKEATNAWCSEAVGYGAKAFNVKYITGSDPSLRLPVTGPTF